jgi:uncharacterized protein (TIGR03437 family)
LISGLYILNALPRTAWITRTLLVIGFTSVAVAAPAIRQVVNAASYDNTVAPGTWAALFGTELAGTTATASGVPLPLSIEGVSVTVGGVTAPLLFVSPGQINALIPFESPTGDQVPVVVNTPAGTSVAFDVVLQRNAPAIFTSNAQGSGGALAFDSSFRPLSAVGRNVIVLYANGLGPTDPVATSSASGGAAIEPFNRITDDVQVWVGEQPAALIFAGLAPGLPGVYQLNLIAAENLASNRLFLVENGAVSNSVTLPIPAGTNVANVAGSIDGLYPASGVYASGLFGPPGQPTAGPVTISQMLTVAGLRLTLDILPTAKPFKIVAATPAGKAVVNVDPVNRVWTGSLPVPSPASRAGDFSEIAGAVIDLPSGYPFPGNQVPASRIDPMAYKAAQLTPFPNQAPTAQSANGTFTTSDVLPADGHLSIGADPTEAGGSPFVFGGFVDLGPHPASTQTAQFVLLVDRMLVAVKNVSYPVY